MCKTKTRRWAWLCVLATVPVLLGTGVASAQQEEVEALIERGHSSYRTHCASCHGVEGKGDGPIAPYMKSMPADLTQINVRNHGEFPFDAIYDIVDGREVPGHGSRTMPVWGPAFMGMTAEPDEEEIKERIVEVVYYLKSIQPPTPVSHPKMGEPSS